MIPALEQYRSHHQELRTRLIRGFLAITLATAAAYLFKDRIALLCIQPLFSAYPQLGKLVYTNLTEAFLSYIKLSLLAGLIVSFPFILYQLWLFIAPGLLDGEKRLVRRIVAWSTMLFAGGALFAYFVALPRLLAFFMRYAGPDLKPMLNLGLYLTFVIRMLLAFGIAFEIPFLMVMALRTGLVRRDYFQSKRTPFYLAIVVLAFLLASGELAATVLLALPLFGLYEAGILAGRVFGGKHTLPAADDSAST